MSIRLATTSFLFLALALSTHSASAQSATVIESRSSSESYTYSNLSGFSITNNGTMTYDGPLNRLTGSPCCIEAVLIVDDTTYTYGADRFESDTGLEAKREGGNTLSLELDRAVIKLPAASDQVALQYSLMVGGVRGGKASQSLSIQEKVDGQSFSIFPQFSPTVFP